MSTRKLTEQQFEDNTVLDTGNLDTAIGDTFSALNNIGPDVDVSSMVQKQIVFGETPPRWDWVGPAGSGVRLNISPWLRTPPPLYDDLVHERLKSNDPYGISLVPASLGIPGNGFCWQVSFWTDKPIVVTDVDIVMHMNASQVRADFPYYTSPFSMNWNDAVKVPNPLIVGDYVEDVVVSLVTDSPFNQQDPSQVNLTLHKNLYAISSQRQTEYDAWDTPDMLPSLVGSEYCRGFWHQAKEVNAPVPAKSRVRVNVFVPDWTPYQDTWPVPINGWEKPINGTYNKAPYSSFLWSGTITYLERKV